MIVGSVICYQRVLFSTRLRHDPRSDYHIDNKPHQLWILQAKRSLEGKDTNSIDAAVAVEENKPKSSRKKTKISQLVEGDDSTDITSTLPSEMIEEPKPKRKRKKSEDIIADDDENEDLDVDEVSEVKAIKKPKVSKNKTTKAKPTLDQILGLNYTLGNEVFDFPFIDEPRWYRISVKSGMEAEMCEKLRLMAKTDWSHFLINATYPIEYSVRFKGKELIYTTKPLYATRMFVKMKMSPDYAELVESIYGIYGFIKKKILKTSNVVVTPLSPADSEEIENTLNPPTKDVEKKYLQLRKDDYVQFISGKHKGKYGILTGTKSGLFEVRLRSETQDEVVSVDMTEIEYLAKPPEKHYKVSTLSNLKVVI